MKIVSWNKSIELNKYKYIFIQVELQVEKWHYKKKFRSSEEMRESGKCKYKCVNTYK